MATLASAAAATDPMEIAIHAASPLERGADELRHAYGLSPDLLAMSNVWAASGKAVKALIAAKGAPEAIAGLCRLPADQAAAMTKAVEAMASRGIRVLGVAVAEAAGTRWGGAQTDYQFSLAGLIGLADPIRESVPAAVAECRSAGIRVVMITGDYAATAQAIAAKAGIVDGEVLTGPELEAMDDAALLARLPFISVFARIMPEQKLRIVEAYKAAGELPCTNRLLRGARNVTRSRGGNRRHLPTIVISSSTVIMMQPARHAMLAAISSASPATAAMNTSRSRSGCSTLKKVSAISRTASAAIAAARVNRMAEVRAGKARPTTERADGCHYWGLLEGCQSKPESQWRRRPMPILRSIRQTSML
jgi:hypothetical protein